MLRSLLAKVGEYVDLNLGYFKDDALSRHVLGAEPDRFTKKDLFLFTSQKFKMLNWLKRSSIL